MSDVAMPRLSDSMEEGTILKWLKSDGDEVSKGEELVEIETDKANMTYEADEAGTLEIVAQEGATLAVGETIARIGEGGGTEDSGEEEPEEEPEEEERAKEPEEEPEPDTSDNGRVKASPIARRMAEERGIDLAGIEGTGPGGRIVKADVEAAAKDGGERKPEPAAAPVAQRGEAGAKGEVEYQELTRLQQTVTRRMAESKATAPDFQLVAEVDMSAAVELRKRLKQVADPAPSFNDMVVKAVALALREHRRVNGAYRDGKFELYSRVNVGIAVAGQDALVVPTIFDADSKSLGWIAKDARGLIEKVREGQITPPEVSGGTFTVSNLGMYGIDQFTAVINPPEAAILAVGAAVAEPVATEDGGVEVHRRMRLTLSIDHRALDGATGAGFLRQLKTALEHPLRIVA
jgi:pyruvate dehydrogenase E2 component (dihydrolipoamide acetyltransferase)